MARITPPFHPIIYVRGYAMTRREIEATTATPYMGFNLGSTKVRQEWDRTIVRRIFESPLIRLMKEFGYSDIYQDGAEVEGPLPSRSVIIHRYYDAADRDFGSGEAPSIEEAARSLSELILQVRDQVCRPAENPEDFRVYLVAHSMGGLVCRCLLQNDAVGSPEARRLVDKVFTYGTPHNGIEILGINVPRRLGIWDVNHFSRANMARFLALDRNVSRVDSLNGRFPAERFFCLVGTNHEDYGLARFAVGPMSDGLVKIENATVQDAPRAFVHKSHSGPFGLVNSEEGYQNLSRFLFGDTFLRGELEIESLPLPPTVEAAHADDRKVRASYYFECSVAVRGVYDCKLSERTYDHGSAIFRTYDELFKPAKVGATEARSPVLFSLFLDSRKVTHGQTIVLSADVTVRTTEYRIDDRLFLDRRIPGEHLYRENLTIRLTPQDEGWNIRYVLTDERWGEQRGSVVQEDERGPFIKLQSPKGFRAALRLRAEKRPRTP
jgi:hypothetical protein